MPAPDLRLQIRLIVLNLLYVPMTRAMDNLNVFTLEGARAARRSVSAASED